MEKIPQINQQPDGWREVTGSYAPNVARFVGENGFWSPEKPSKYDGSGEIEFSGGTKRNAEVVAGTLWPSEVKIYYENGKPEKIHAYFEGLDVYISGKAMKDFLATLN